MITAVVDTNIIVSAIYWPRSAGRRCLAGLARRQYAIAVTREIFDEYESVVADFQPRFPNCNSAGALSWLRFKARWVEPASLGKQRSRDPKDDPFLACALAARARYLVTWDKDLLAMEKPFGIEMIAPMQFVKWLQQGHQQ
jgi:putative PIN family toxin of toxin-antitoxin system